MILHGVNMVYKRPPYYPSAAGFNAPDAKFLRRHGFDSVRLGVLYQAVEPHPGSYRSSYLRHIARTQRALARQGVFSLLDFHQDLYAEKFTGEGFPAWAILDNGAPAEPLTGFPGTYLSSPGENAAWNSFWQNAAGPGGVGLQDRYAAAWKDVANHFRRQRYVMGYDLINEPWPGSVWPTCASTEGCPGFEAGMLAPMEEKAIAQIRQVDRLHTIWYEPVVTSQFGTKYDIPDLGDANLGMSFHVYCLQEGAPGCDRLEQLSVDNAQARADQNGDTLMMTEFGATTDAAEIEGMVDRDDRGMVSWQWWAYCGCDDPTTNGPGDTQAIVHDPKRAPTGANVFHSKLALLDRPYPMAVAGTPRSFFYDRTTDTFTLGYSTRAPDGERLPRGVETIVYLPRLHYRRGYSVGVKGAKVESAAGSPYLRLRRSKRAQSVSLTVMPRGVQ